MTMTDTVILVREAKTCSYVVVIHTPRLCGEPGFKSRLEFRDEAYIRCREIVDSVDPSTQTETPLAESDRPRNKLAPRNPLLPVPAQRPPPDTKIDSTKAKAQETQDRLRKALEALVSNKGDGDFPQVIVEQVNLGVDGEEDVVFQFPLDEALFEDGGADEAGTHQSILKALQAAGFDVKGEKKSEKQDEKKTTKKKESKEDSKPPQGRDEL